MSVNPVREMVKSASYFHKWSWDIKKVMNNGSIYNIQSGCKDIKIAVLDSGIDINHPDLKRNVLSTGKSFISNTKATCDDSGHGTMVAGTIAAQGNLLGIGPSLGLVPYKVIDKNNNGNSDTIIQAIYQAVDDRNDIINLSLGTYKSKVLYENDSYKKKYIDAINYAINHGVILVASAGSLSSSYSNSSYYHLPSDLKNVLTVMSSNRVNNLTDYTNYRYNMCFTIPGGDFGPLWKEKGKIDIRHMCLVTYPVGLEQTPLSINMGLKKGYEFMFGTSLASAKLTGVIGLLQSQALKIKGAKLKFTQIYEILTKSSKRRICNGKVYRTINTYHALLQIY